MVYAYITRNYDVNEPIFISDLVNCGLKMPKIRKEVMRLTADEKLKRFDTGIYYIPGTDEYRFDEKEFIYKIIKKRYLYNEEGVIGYHGGVTLGLKIGFTIAQPDYVRYDYEIVSNKATRDYRVMKIKDVTYIVRQPRVTVTKENYQILQLLDLVKEMSVFGFESFPIMFGSKISYYIRNNTNLKMDDLKRYMCYYPVKVFKNLYMMELFEIS